MREDWPTSVERGCQGPGHWLVEGADVRRVSRGRWEIDSGDGEPITCPTLTAAMWEIADRIEHGTW